MAELYKLTFNDGKSYIGATIVNSIHRFRCHRVSSKKLNYPVYKAWREFGEPILEILAIVEKHMLIEAEMKAIKIYDTLIPNGYNEFLGNKHSERTKKLTSLVHKNKIVSEETKAKMIGNKYGRLNKGIPKTEAHKAKLIGNKSAAGMKWMNDGTSNKLIKLKDVNSYINSGFIFGRINMKANERWKVLK